MPKQEVMQTAAVASANMIPPSVDESVRKRDYPELKIPPVAHARLWRDGATNALALTYNGHDIVRFHFSKNVSTQPTCYSNGNMQSFPFIQQFLVRSNPKEKVTVEFFSPYEIRNMRPKRANDHQAILGQLGHPLIKDVNGIYFVEWDLMVSFHGLPFAWIDSEIQKENDGYHAKMSVEIGERPFLMLFMPHYYSDHLGYKQHEPWNFKPNPKSLSGWCSWEAYHSKVTQEDIWASAKTVAPLKKHGLEYMQIDDGFQQILVPMEKDTRIFDSWLNTNEKFPDGHDNIVEAMHSEGFKAGVWTNATLTNKEASESTHHCLHDQNGELICGDWIRYVIDCSEEILENDITPYYRALREKGYEYFKSDSIRHLLYDGQQEAVRLGLLDNETASKRQTDYMRAARKGIGDDAYYLSCWGTLSQSIGIADAMRIAGDTNPSFSSYSMQVRESARWFFAQRVMFTLDPDVLCVRGELPYVRMMASHISLMGGLYMISDKPEVYDEERMEIVRRTMPPLTTTAAETGVIDYSTPACLYLDGDQNKVSHDISFIDDSKTPFSSLWCMHMAHGGRSWCVMQRSAVVPLDAITLNVDALSLDNTKCYCAYDFWNETLVPVQNGVIKLPALSLGDCTVLSITEIQENTPVLLASDRHVSMDAISVVSSVQAQNGYALTLKGFENLKVHYVIYKGNLKGTIQCQENASATIQVENNILHLYVTFHQEDAYILLG